MGWSDLYGGFWLLATYEHVQDVARDHERYTTRGGIMIPPTAATMPVVPAEFDPPEHTAYRKLTLPYFTARAVAAMEPDTREIVRTAIAGFAHDGRAELVGSLADVVPPLVIGTALGLDHAACAQVRGLAGAFLSTATVGIEAQMRAARELQNWLQEQIRARREHPTDDTLSELVNARTDGEVIPPVVALGMVQLMVLRTDEYGGPENRSRFLVEVLTAVRAAVGPGYPLGLRVSPDGPADQTTPDDIAALITRLEAARLIDFVDVSLGSHYARDLLMGGAREEPLPAPLHRDGDPGDLPADDRGGPVHHAGRRRRGDRLGGRGPGLDGAGDAGRTQARRQGGRRPEHGDPTLHRVSAELRGRPQRPQPGDVTVNPAAGRELTLDDTHISRAGPARRVVVVGGGPAGSRRRGRPRWPVTTSPASRRARVSAASCASCRPIAASSRACSTSTTPSCGGWAWRSGSG